MSEDEPLHIVPVTWIKQYHFCPRIVYFLGVLGYDERVTESMVEGREIHETEDRRGGRRKTLGGAKKERVKARWSKLHVVSGRLGIEGVVDEVVETERGLAVVEVKWARAPRKPPPGHVYQAAAYAMLAEEVIGRPVKRVVLRYALDGKSFEIPVTDEVRRHVLWTVSRIRSIVEGERLPRARRARKCSSCGFARVCGGA